MIQRRFRCDALKSKSVSKMSSSGAVYEVTSEHARITQPQAPDYFSIPWNDDFSTESFSIVFTFVLSLIDVSFYGCCCAFAVLQLLQYVITASVVFAVVV